MNGELKNCQILPKTLVDPSTKIQHPSIQCDDMKGVELTLRFSSSMACSTQPTVPSPPATSTRHVTSGSRWHHSNALSGEISAKSITCRYHKVQQV